MVEIFKKKKTTELSKPIDDFNLAKISNNEIIIELENIESSYNYCCIIF